MQDIALKIGTAPASGNLFLSLAGQKTPEAAEAGIDQVSIADKFTKLIQMFAGAKNQLMANDSAVGAQGDALLQAGMEVDAAAAGGELQLDIENLLLMAGVEADAGDISPEIMAQLAALMQQIPQLQTMLYSKADLQIVADAIDYLQMTKTPDLAQFNLPVDVKDLLMKLSQDKAALVDLGAAVQKLQLNPELVKAIDVATDAGVDVAPLPNAFDRSAMSDKLVISADAGTKPVDKAAIILDEDAIKVAQEAAIKAKLPLNAAVQPAENPKTHNILAEARVVVDLPTQLNRADISKLMSDIKINGADVVPAQDIVSAQAESSASLSFDQAMSQAMHASDALQAGKLNIMTAAGIDAYGLRAAVGGVPAHIASLQVAVQLQRNLQQRTNNFFIQLQPEELGRIEVTLKFEGNRVRALISAEKEETLQLLKQDAKALDRALQGSGIETDAGSLEFSLGQNFQNFDEAKKNHHHDRSFGTMIANEIPDTDTKQDLNAAMIMMMAEGRVDVKL